MMGSWGTAAALAVASTFGDYEHADRIESALASEWEFASSPSDLASCMRATASAFRQEQPVSELWELFMKATWCNVIDDESRLKEQFSKMTGAGCLSGDEIHGAPDDPTVSALFCWLCSVCGSDVDSASQALSSFADLLTFIADGVDFSSDPEELLRRFGSRQPVQEPSGD